MVFGVAAAGPRDDGAYYQALVDEVEAFSEENGYEDPIVVDNITAEDAATELANLAEQGVDMIIVGASEIADPLADLIAQYPDIFWYCNCGAGYPENPGLAQSQDDASEISYTAGYATGLLLQDTGGDSVAFIGCCDLGFEKEAFMAFELGLQAVDPSLHDDVRAHRGFPFDFDNTAGATEAFNTALAEGADAVYPYLGGAHEPVVQARQRGRASSRCRRARRRPASATDLDYQIQVKFDAGDYIDADPRRRSRPASSSEGDVAGVPRRRRPAAGCRDLRPDARAADGDGGGLRARSRPATSPTQFGRSRPRRTRRLSCPSRRQRRGGGRLGAHPGRRAAAHHQALRRVVACDGVDLHAARRARSTACSARTAPASRR